MEISKYAYKILFLGDNFRLKNMLISAICGHKEYERRIICCEYRYRTINIDEKLYNLKLLNIDECDIYEQTVSEYLKCVHFVIYVSDNDYYYNKIIIPKLLVDKNVNVYNQSNVEEFFKNIVVDLIQMNTIQSTNDENKVKFRYNKKMKKKNWNCF
jgi:hypothetical protein